MLREWLIYDNIFLFIIFSTIIFISSWNWYKHYVARPLNTNTRRTDIVLRHIFYNSPIKTPQHIPLALIIYILCWLFFMYSSFISIPVKTPFWNYGIYNRTGAFYWIFYLSTIVTLIMYYARQQHGGITLNTVTALIFLILFISFYFSTSNFIAIIFILECQGTLLLLFLISNSELLKRATNIKTYAANTKHQRTWRINLLLLQFWINFFGATTLILFSLLLTTHIGTNRFLDLKITNTQLLDVNTSPLFPAWLCFWLICGILLKISAFPFHFWKPELYRVLSYPNMFIYAGLYTLLLFTLVIYIFKVIRPGWLQFIHPLLWTISILTVYFITPVFFRITDIKLFLAYTSVFHALYIIIITVSSNNFVQYAMAYNIVYFFTVISIFSVLLLYKTLDLKFLSDFQTLIYNPAIIFWIIASIASMAGLPPFLGFWTKFAILLNLWSNSEFLLMIHLFSCSLIIMYFYFANYRFAGAINLVRRTNYLNKLNAPQLFIIGNIFTFINIYSLGLINDLFNFTLYFNNLFI